MRAFLTRSKLGSQRDHEKVANTEKSLRQDPLPEWLPTPLITTTSTASMQSHIPSPELSSGQLSPVKQSPIFKPTESSTAVSSLSAPTQSNYPIPPALKPAPIQSNSLSSPSDDDFVPSLASWSAFTEENLVVNINSRERTRQEVLYEIVSSEERYDGFFKFPFANLTNEILDM